MKDFMWGKEIWFDFFTVFGSGSQSLGSPSTNVCVLLLVPLGSEISTLSSQNRAADWAHLPANSMSQDVLSKSSIKKPFVDQILLSTEEPWPLFGKTCKKLFLFSGVLWKKTSEKHLVVMTKGVIPPWVSSQDVFLLTENSLVLKSSTNTQCSPVSSLCCLQYLAHVCELQTNHCHVGGNTFIHMSSQIHHSSLHSSRCVAISRIRRPLTDWGLNNRRASEK